MSQKATSSKPTLYLFNGNVSSNAWRAHLALLEKGIDFDLKYLDGFKKEHKTPEILALNPFGQVPIYTEGPSFVLVESVAIMLYVDKLSSKNPLMPTDAKQYGIASMRLIQVSEKLWDFWKIFFSIGCFK